jgi:polysaccharide chain length determinant protein (PEP-CTERM system associated)
MSTRRELSVEDWLKILRRRRWLFILPAVLGAVAGLVASFFLPRQYTSHTTVLVEEPMVPDSYVKPVVSDDLNQRLASMQGEILSRTRLQQLLQEFHLYPKETDRVPMEVLIERLRKAIKVTPLSTMPGTLARSLPGFNVDVTFGEARVAQQICNEITSMFMVQNAGLREVKSEDTTRFLAQQLAEAKAKLDEQDAKLADFQTRYMGEQPGDENTNLTLLTGMTTQLEAATQNLSQAQQEKAFVESMLSQQVAAERETADGHSPQTLQQQLSALQTQLATLQAQYTEQHPSVVRAKHEIELLQKKIREAPGEAEALAQESNATGPLVESPQIQQLRAHLHQVELSVSQKKQEQAQLQHRIKVLQARLELSPKVQQEFKALTRDYQTALGFYNDLLKKQEESQMATDLEHRQQGENFRVLDPPSLPVRPSFPDPRLFTLGGTGAGLILGAALVQLAESRDKSLRTARDVELFLRVPAIAVISSLRGAQESGPAPWMLARKPGAFLRPASRRG